MKRLIYTLAFFILGASTCFAQFTLNATVPATTNVCFAYGNFNSWNVSSTQMTYVSTTGSTKLFTLNLPLTFVNSGTFKVMGGPASSFEQTDAQFSAVASGTIQNVTITSFKATAYPITINVTVPVTLTECYVYGSITYWTTPINPLKMTLTTTNSTTKVFSYLYYDSSATHNINVLFLSALDGVNKTYIQSNPDQWHNTLYTGTASSCDFTITTFSPGISTSQSTLTGFAYSYGSGASSEQSFTVNAANLIANLTVTPSTDYQISTGTGGSFVASNPITLTKDASGNIANTTIYVRLKAGLGVNSYNAENVVCASTGATVKNVACSGGVSQKPLTITGISGVNKVTDGTTTATLSGNAALSGVLSADLSNVTLGGTFVANFSQSSVGNSLGITVSGYSISGSAIGNYSLTQPVGLTANIYPVISTFSGTGTTNLSSGSNITYSPLSTTDLVVSSGELVVDQSATVHSVVVNPGAKLTLNNSTALTATNGITLQNTASGTASFVDNRISDSPSAITGTVQQAITETNRNWYVGIPVSGKSATDITLSGSKIIKRNEGASSWDDVTGSLTAGVGYVSVASTNSGTTTWSLNGNLNSGKVQVAVTRSGASSTGFNLLGNPYPSYLNWEQVLNLDASNASLLQSTIWYRTATYNNGASKFDYTFNTYNSTGRISTPSSTTGYIPPMQAFWVRANNAGTVTFTNAMRSHGDGASNKLKAPSANKATQQVLRLQVSNGANMDETVIYINPNASNNFDNYDSQKMSNNSASIPEIFTVAGTEQLVINGMNSVTPNQEIPLGFTTGQSNAFSIKATEVSNFDAGTQVILIDNQTNTQWNLSDGSAYNFSSDVIPSSTSRFSIVFKSVAITTGNINNESEKESVLVYRNNNNLIAVNCVNGIVGQATVSVYNTMGQRLAERTLTSIITVLDKSFPSGVYLVSVISNGKTTTQKIVIN